ncbi:translation initiation factor IF-2-like [Vidua chalybeata]|uniref:translation initiation factor IF-2-like n=1 Tax=Vidua chalybeata TaxID=81927 RepID=UPI0023A88692|nr:translation initiation factor IF-2-like [Vidua chalybeata]
MAGTLWWQNLSQAMLQVDLAMWQSGSQPSQRCSRAGPHRARPHGPRSGARPGLASIQLPVQRILPESGTPTGSPDPQLPAASRNGRPTFPTAAGFASSPRSQPPPSRPRHEDPAPIPSRRGDCRVPLHAFGSCPGAFRPLRPAPRNLGPPGDASPPGPSSDLAPTHFGRPAASPARSPIPPRRTPAAAARASSAPPPHLSGRGSSGQARPEEGMEGQVGRGEAVRDGTRREGRGGEGTGQGRGEERRAGARAGAGAGAGLLPAVAAESPVPARLSLPLPCPRGRRLAPRFRMTAAGRARALAGGSARDPGRGAWCVTCQELGAESRALPGGQSALWESGGGSGSGRPRSLLGRIHRFCGPERSCPLLWAGPVSGLCAYRDARGENASAKLRAVRSVRESQNRLCWKKPLRPSNPSYDRTPPSQLERGTECQMFS